MKVTIVGLPSSHTGTIRCLLDDAYRELVQEAGGSTRTSPADMEWLHDHVLSSHMDLARGEGAVRFVRGEHWDA